jgi:Rrf2 family protein
MCLFLKNSLAYESALHSLILMALLPSQERITIKQLAFMLGVQPSYLAKIFTQLGKAELVDSSLGSKGGVSFSRSPETISFYDVYHAMNGRSHMFQCSNIRAKSRGLEVLPGMCEVHSTIWEAENKMFSHLKETSIQDMAITAMKKHNIEDEGIRCKIVEHLFKEYKKFNR